MFQPSQIFNEFNAREIGDSPNILKGLGTNVMFLLVILFTVRANFVGFVASKSLVIKYKMLVCSHIVLHSSFLMLWDLFFFSAGSPNCRSFLNISSLSMAEILLRLRVLQQSSGLAPSAWPR